MIIKQRDAQGRTILALEQAARQAQDPVHRNGCRSAAARLRDDPTQERACRLLDETFGASDDWAVLHDLRVPIGRFVLHLNHLLINEFLECVCVDSRYLQRGLRRLEDGRFLAAASPEDTVPIGSPLSKAARDARMVHTLIDDRGPLRRWLGMGPQVSVQAVVLHDPALGVGAPGSAAREANRLMGADALFPMLWKRRRRMRPFERVTTERLQDIAQHLVERHQPNFSRALLDPVRRTASVATAGPVRALAMTA